MEGTSDKVDRLFAQLLRMTNGNRHLRHRCFRSALFDSRHGTTEHYITVECRSDDARDRAKKWISGRMNDYDETLFYYAIGS